ncbi:hypothetical protein [Kitasatospora fiedleri]|uniref:hypothetical protein n=1 Tax=Kitasatospora fiedleri TaxID=2991545 RepID=UPI002989EEB4|nr:hypothetical protein [Kitasatospora fiedleri]
MSPSTSRVVTVRWAGGDVRRGPLTLGQANMVRCILRDGAADVDIHDVWAVPAGVSVAAVIDALRALTLRHEALRTVFPHPEGALPEEQLVHSEGEFTVRVVDHDPLPRTRRPSPTRWPGRSGWRRSTWAATTRCGRCC